MKSYAMTLNLKDDPALIAEYKRHHQAVWPEVIEGLRKIRVTRTKIFLHGRRLFMYMEAPDDFDPGRDLPKYMENPRAREWDEWMRSFQEPVPGAGSNDWWTPMEEVFSHEIG